MSEIIFTGFPATQGKQKKSFFYFSRQGKIRDFVKNVKYQGNLRKSLNLKLRKKPGNFKFPNQLVKALNFDESSRNLPEYILI